MNGRDEHPDRSGGLARPYIARASSSIGGVFEDPDVTGEIGVRPYYLTKGRTSSLNEIVSYETMVVVAVMPSPYIHSLRFEERELVELCVTPQSIAEISAKLHVPIAVARVLSGDLAAYGVLDVYSPPSDVIDDIELIDAVIDGLRQL